MHSTHSVRFHAVPFLAATVGLIVFQSCLNSDLVWDDRAAVKLNGDVNGENAWYSLLHHDFWGQDITSPTSHKSFRPVTVASLRADFNVQSLWQQLGFEIGPSTVFHSSNILLHGFSSAGTVYICRYLGLSETRSALAGLLFAVHPVHTEAVCSVVSRADLLATAALVIALILYVSAVRSLTVHHGEDLAGSSPVARALRTMTSPLARMLSAWGIAALGVFAKETGLMIIPTLMLVDIMQISGQSVSTAATADTGRASKGKGQEHQSQPAASPAAKRTPPSPATANKAARVAQDETVGGNSLLGRVVASARSILVDEEGGHAVDWSLQRSTPWLTWLLANRMFRLAANAVLTVALLTMRLKANRGGGFYHWSVFENQMSLMPRGLSRTLTLAHSHAWYAYLFLFPKDMAYLHGYAQLAPVTSVMDVQAVAGLLLYVSLVVVVLMLVLARRRLLLWCMAATLASFLLASNTVVWVGTEVAERLLYQPSLPALIGVAAAAPISSLESVLEAGGAGVTFPAVAQGATVSAVLALSWWWASVRAQDWKTELSLFERGYSVSPKDLRAANNLAMALLAAPVTSPEHRAANRGRALVMLRQAVEEQPALQYLAAANVAALALAEGDRASALKYAWQAVNTSAAAGVSDRLPCSTASTLASVYLSMAQDNGSTDMDKDFPWAVEAGGATQAQWRSTIMPAPLHAKEAPTGPVHISPAGLAEVAAQVSISGGCWNPEMLHVLGCTLLLLEQETGPSGPGDVALPPNVRPGPGPALFDFLQSLMAAGLGVRTVEAATGNVVNVLVAPELPAIPGTAESAVDSLQYSPPGVDGLAAPPVRLVAQLVLLPFKGKGGVEMPSARLATQTPLHGAETVSDRIPGSTSASREQTGSTLSMMGTAARALGTSPALVQSDETAAANLLSLSDALTRIAVFLQPNRPAYRTNLAIIWASHAQSLSHAAGLAGEGVAPYFAAALAEAEEALRLARGQGTSGMGLAPYWSNVGYVLEKQATHLQSQAGRGQALESGVQEEVHDLLGAALQAYTAAAELAPNHSTIQANVQRLKGYGAAV